MSRNTIIIGASGGIGAALMRQAEARWDSVTGFARSFAGLLHLDLENEASIVAAAAHLPVHVRDVLELLAATGVVETHLVVSKAAEATLAHEIGPDAAATLRRSAG